MTSYLLLVLVIFPPTAGSEPSGLYMSACEEGQPLGCAGAILENAARSMEPATARQNLALRKKMHRERGPFMLALDGDLSAARESARDFVCTPLLTDVIMQDCLETWDPVACTLIAVQRYLGVCGPRDEASALELATAACSVGQPAACVLLGDLAIEENPLEVNSARARTLVADACGTGYDRGCMDLAMMARLGTGGLRDLMEARRQFERLCDLNDHQACGYLADMLDQGLGGPEDRGEAIRLYDMRCRKGYDRWSCGALATQLERAGPTQDLPRVRKVLAAACDADKAWGCVGVARYHLNGLDGLERDFQIGGKLLEKACKLTNEKACDTLEQLRKAGLYCGEKGGPCHPTQ